MAVGVPSNKGQSGEPLIVMEISAGGPNESLRRVIANKKQEVVPTGRGV
jgi:hypothetical protein